MMAHASAYPPFTSSAPVSGAVPAGFKTETGVKEPEVEGPAPSALIPQHMALESVITAQEKYDPAVTSATPLVRPVTCIGVSVFVSCVPSSPSSLSPQHIAAPAVVTAQV